MKLFLKEVANRNHIRVHHRAYNHNVSGPFGGPQTITASLFVLAKTRYPRTNL